MRALESSAQFGVAFPCAQRLAHTATESPCQKAVPRSAGSFFVLEAGMGLWTM